MAILVDQLPRLLRTDWDTAGPQALAFELFSMFSANDPVQMTSGAAISNPNGSPPLTLTTNTTIDNTEVPPIVVNIGGIQVPNVPLPPGTNPLSPPPPPPGSGGGNAFAGQVVSGSGTMYSCQIWSGPTTGPAAGTVNVLMLNITSDDTIPPGAWVLVLKLQLAASINNRNPVAQYVGLPPTFLGPASP